MPMHDSDDDYNDEDSTGDGQESKKETEKKPQEEELSDIGEEDGPGIASMMSVISQGERSQFTCDISEVMDNLRKANESTDPQFILRAIEQVHMLCKSRYYAKARLGACGGSDLLLSIFRKWKDNIPIFSIMCKTLIEYLVNETENKIYFSCLGFTKDLFDAFQMYARAHHNPENAQKAVSTTTDDFSLLAHIIQICIHYCNSKFSGLLQRYVRLDVNGPTRYMDEIYQQQLPNDDNYFYCDNRLKLGEHGFPVEIIHLFNSLMRNHSEDEMDLPKSVYENPMKTFEVTPKVVQYHHYQLTKYIARRVNPNNHALQTTVAGGEGSITGNAIHVASSKIEQIHEHEHENDNDESSVEEVDSYQLSIDIPITLKHLGDDYSHAELHVLYLLCKLISTLAEHDFNSFGFSLFTIAMFAGDSSSLSYMSAISGTAASAAEQKMVSIVEHGLMDMERKEGDGGYISGNSSICTDDLEDDEEQEELLDDNNSIHTADSKATANTRLRFVTASPMDEKKEYKSSIASVSSYKSDHKSYSSAKHDDNEDNDSIYHTPSVASKASQLTGSQITTPMMIPITPNEKSRLDNHGNIIYNNMHPYLIILLVRYNFATLFPIIYELPLPSAFTTASSKQSSSRKTSSISVTTRSHHNTVPTVAAPPPPVIVAVPTCTVKEHDVAHELDFCLQTLWTIIILCSDNKATHRQLFVHYGVLDILFTLLEHFHDHIGFLSTFKCAKKYLEYLIWTLTNVVVCCPEHIKLVAEDMNKEKILTKLANHPNNNEIPLSLKGKIRNAYRSIYVSGTGPPSPNAKRRDSTASSKSGKSNTSGKYTAANDSVGSKTFLTSSAASARSTGKR